jgi:hypothetical protein
LSRPACLGRDGCRLRKALCRDGGRMRSALWGEITGHSFLGLGGAFGHLVFVGLRLKNSVKRLADRS